MRRVALLSGASAGIGRAVAEHLLDHGWSVLGVDRADASLSHPAYRHAVLDLCDEAALRALATREPADALVHAAGFMQTARLDALSVADGERMWRLHVQAATVLTQAWLPHLLAAAKRGAGGRVVYIGSRVAHGMPGRGQYAAVKAALVAMARSWAMEWAAHGLTFNVVAPAATATAMLHDPGRASSPPRLPPIGRLIEPLEVAALVAYLLGPHAGAITGQELTLCGGASLPG